MLKFTIPFLFIFISCQSNKSSNDNYKNIDGTEKFICTKNKFSDFIISSVDYDKSNKPYEIVKAFRGKIINNTKTIFKKAIIRPEIILELENGNTLSSIDIDITKVLGGSPEFEIITDWKPNQEWEIDYLETCSFSVEYVNYPIKKVWSQYYVEIEDQINNKNDNILISQSDITENWKTVIRKVNSKISDCNNNKDSKQKYLDNHEKKE